MPDKFSEITKSVAGYHFSELDSLFYSLNIADSDWSLREAKHEFNQLIDRELSGVKPVKSPKLTVISGIPYSGKSTFFKAHSHLFVDSLDIAFDNIMQRMSFYHRIAQSDPRRAFEKCELLARVIGYELLNRAADKGVNVVLEHSSTPSQHLDLYLLIQKAYGYQIEFIFIDCSLETALNRAQTENMKRDGERYTPPEYIEQRYKLLQSMLNKYQQHFTIKVYSQHELNFNTSDSSQTWQHL
ncbi:zeta toxin family protein [Vibrio hannami]|uniref:zeta toxin family protein n=1 Tax=Vibrio hannami TaxID=2717094 RepID=UPI00241081C9|nr:zeta toxin family protein [Vibrio hannami]MDG3084741.1 zeta toxin family protein [Vibrio hannami]